MNDIPKTHTYPLLLLPKVLAPPQFAYSKGGFLHIKTTCFDNQGRERMLYNGTCDLRLIHDSYEQPQSYYCTNDFNNNLDNFGPNNLNALSSHLTYQENFQQFDMNKSSLMYTASQSVPLESNMLTFDNYLEANTNYFSIDQTNAANSFDDAFETVEEIISTKYVRRSVRQQNKKNVIKVSVPSREVNPFPINTENNIALEDLLSSVEEPRNQKIVFFVADDEDDDEDQSRNTKYANDSGISISLDDDGIGIDIAEGSSDSEWTIAKCKNTNKTLKCIICNETFTRSALFKKHLLEHDTSKKDEKLYSCDVCHKKYVQHKRFMTHMSRHGDPDFECQICHQVFASKNAMNNHCKQHKANHFCNHCNKPFMQEGRLLKHLSTKHPEKSSTLDISLLADELNLEEEIDENTDLIADPTADLSFDGDLLSSNFDKQLDFDQAVEDQCDYVIKKVLESSLFDFEINKNGRRKYKKGPLSKVCNLCPKSFSRHADLQRHHVSHLVSVSRKRAKANSNGDLVYRCCFCGTQGFLKIDQLKFHYRKHAHMTLYQCTFCDKSFSDSSNFSKHKKVHGGSSVHQCDLCKRKFHSKVTIARHMQDHIKNPPVVCEICYKVFYFQSVLNKHKRIAHNNKKSKPQCQVCSTQFSSMKEKWDHLWYAHNVRSSINDCDACDQKFRKYIELREHSKIVHGITLKRPRKIKN